MDDSTAPSMPQKVATAIAEVMEEIPKLAKGEKNTHGNYNFASIDDFLEAVRPLCARRGLIIVQDEESFETKDIGGKPWLFMQFRFTLAHSSGETWAHRPARSIMVNAAMGAQAFGAAQSYALKQFMRSLFQIATGEKDDADFHEQSNLPKAERNPPGITKFRGEARAFYKDLYACTTYDEYVAFVQSADAKAFLENAMKNFPKDWEGDGEDVKGIRKDMEIFCDRLKADIKKEGF